MTTHAGASILIVDDEAQVRTFAAQLLTQYGFRCAEASSAGEALDAVAADTPQIVLTDVSMPGASGIALVSALSPLQPDVASIVLTASGDPDVAHRALNAGAFGYVRKPFDPNDLLVAVNGALRRRALAIEDRHQRAELEERITAQTLELEESRLEAVERLARAVESRDGGTAAHVDRMSTLACRLARSVGWSEEDAQTLRIASRLHDIGKVGIPDHILLKAGELSPDERSAIETHPEVGRAILAGAKSELLRLGELVAWTHHERVDGSGYPRALAGDEIPAAGRIAAVADVFDALTNDRPYRAALDRREALEIIRRDQGLDPEIVAALARVTRSAGNP